MVDAAYRFLMTVWVLWRILRFCMDGIAFQKSKKFAVRIVRLYMYLHDEKRESIMSKQLLRCGTSIGANLAEAEYAASKNDFQSKAYIALKETSETLYWLELLYNTGYLNARQYSSMYRDAEEVRRILSASTKTLRERAE